MDNTTDPKPTVKSVPSNTIPIRINRLTSRHLRSLIATCNRKSHGRKVKADDIIHKSLSLLEEGHLEEIKSTTYTSQDHLEIEFKKYCQAHGQITKDQFLAILLTNAIPQVANSKSNTQEQI